MAKKSKKLPIYVSPRGKAKWAKLTEPDTKFKKEGEFSIQMTFPLAESKDMLTKMEEVAAKAFEMAEKDEDNEGKKIKKADLPYQVDEAAGTVTMRFKMPASYTDKETGEVRVFHPGVYDAGNKPLPLDLKIGNDSECKVAFNIKPFFTPLLGAGISLRLKAVRVLKLIEFVNGSAAAFGEAEEGYSAADAAADSDDVDQVGDDKGEF